MKNKNERSRGLTMTAASAALLSLMAAYRQLNYGLSKIEVQKLAYFLQEAGEDLRLQFVKHHYGPYADALRHALDKMVATREHAQNPEQALEYIQAWNKRKRQLMKSAHIEVAWQQLTELGWIKMPTAETTGH